MYNIGIHIGGYAATLNTEDGPVESWVEVFTIEAVAPSGHTFVLVGSDTDDEGQADLELRTLDHDPGTCPAAWVEGEPVYGSDAWDGEAEYRLACFEADAFGEPRPRWAL